MHIPETPPKTGDDASSKFWRELEAKLLPLEDHYLHWDHLRQKQIPIAGVSHKQWWQLLKAKRRARAQPLPFTTDQNQPYYWVLDDCLVKKLMAAERYLHTQLEPLFTRSIPHEAFIRETVMSQILSGAAININSAVDLLASGRPATESETALLHHYTMLMKLTDYSQHSLDETLLKTLWSEMMGRFFTPAEWSENCSTNVEKLCHFANQADEDYPGFMHPIIKGLLLHYLLIQLKPFKEGNARVAKVLFYWELLKNNYLVFSEISLSEVLYRHREAYQQSFLYVETDDYDITYFLLHQLDLLLEAMKHYKERLITTLAAQEHLQQQAGSKSLNPRQLAILHEMQTYPHREYRLATYKQRFNVTYETSRTDLMTLAQLALVKQRKIGKAFVYFYNII